jgi:hypothetical protein
MNELTGHWRASFDNKYLGAWNLWDEKTKAFRTVTVTIERIVQEQLVKPGGKKEIGWVCYFRGKRTGMILSKTMGRVLQGMYGRTMSDWIGKEVTLWVEPDVRVQGGVGDVLRIKNTSAGKALMRRLAPPPPIEEDSEPVEVPELEKFGGDDA